MLDTFQKPQRDEKAMHSMTVSDFKKVGAGDGAFKVSEDADGMKQEQMRSPKKEVLQKEISRSRSLSVLSEEVREKFKSLKVSMQLSKRREDELEYNEQRRNAVLACKEIDLKPAAFSSGDFGAPVSLPLVT